MVDQNPTISIITINFDGLNIPLKRQIVTMHFLKQKKKAATCKPQTRHNYIG